MLHAPRLAALAALCAAAVSGTRAARNFTLYPGTNVRVPNIVRGALNVFLITHSHDDVGWLKGPEDYYTGARAIGIDPDGFDLPSVYYANGAVYFILTTVMEALAADPARTFTVVEQWYFQRWYAVQNSAMQSLVRSLLASGQLVFANGGLVMHDEAAPTYIDMMDQTTAGVRWIAQTFGAAALPRVTSQLDPFGHSATQVAYFASPSAGYIGTFHARMDFEEVSKRASTRTMDFAWAPSASLGTAALTLGSLGYYGYSPPDGFCIDIGIECELESILGPYNTPINDDPFPDATNLNIAEFVSLMLQTAATQSGAYPADSDGTVLLPVTMGDDFQYTSASYNFVSLDRLIVHVNANTSQNGVNLIYANQAMYAQARIDAQTPLSLKTCDGMPYADGPHDVWSGYFTSRPALKGFIRDTSAMFQAAKQLQAWVAPPQDTWITNPLWLIETAMGVAQHHDAVTGTSKQVVAYDYAQRLQRGRDTAGAAMSGWINTAANAKATAVLTWVNCDLANATICALTEAAGTANITVALNIYNAGSQVRAGGRATVRIPVPVAGGVGPVSWRVVAADGGTPIVAQLVPASPADASLRTTYYGVPASSMQWLCFLVPGTGIPAAGFTTVFVQPVAQAELAPLTHASTLETVALRSSAQRLRAASDSSAQTTVITNGVVSVTFDSITGLMSSYASSDPNSVSSTSLTQALMYYFASQGDAADDQKSGAYILRPNATVATPIATSVNLTVARGPVVNEAWQVFDTWASQVIRLWANMTDGFEHEWTVGPIPVEQLVGPGKEVISRWSTGWATNATWWTDSNGREMQLRIRNFRPDYTINVTEPVAMNYFPINTAVRMQDTNTGAVFTVVTPVSQGGGSLADGDMELMVHRRLIADDSRGVLEALNEPGVNLAGLIVRNTHRVILSKGLSAGVVAHKAAVQDHALVPLQVRGAPLSGFTSPSAWLSTGVRPSVSLLAAAQPANVFVATVHAWNSTSLLVRLAHLFDASDPTPLAGAVNIALAALFSPAALTVTGAVEMTVTAGQPLAEVPPVTYTYSSTDWSAVPTPGGVEAFTSKRHKPANAKVARAAAAAGNQVIDAVAGTPLQITLPIVPPAPNGANLTVTLQPMQLRTFLCQVTYM